MYVEQLFQNDKPISVCSASELFGLTWIEYHGIMDAIPNQWRRHINGEHESEVEMKYSQAVQRKDITSWAYKQLSYQTGMLLRKAEIWTGVLGVLISNQYLVECVRNIDWITNVPKLRSFQYKLRQGALVTNVQLHRWKI